MSAKTTPEIIMLLYVIRCYCDPCYPMWSIGWSWFVKWNSAIWLKSFISI